MRFYLTYLGCRLNYAEIAALARSVRRAGHDIAADPADADWAIINTCTVTHVAARKSRQAIRRLHRGNPELGIAVIGCYAEMSAQAVREIEGVTLVVPNAEKDCVLERILAIEQAPGNTPGLAPALACIEGRTRALVKIQDGCDNRCTYCIVTIARGPSRSRRPDGIIQEIRERVAQGYREIVLTGVNIGAYGRDRGSKAVLPTDVGWTLARLVRGALDDTGVGRLRLSSIEPWDVDENLLALWQDARLCPHLHLPLQSGCDAVLLRMGRHYDVRRFAELVARVRQRAPDVSLTTDLIVGFPGETEHEFAESLAFVARMRFARLHVFNYSPRPGTVAASLPNRVAPPIAQQQSQRMVALGQRLATAFHQQHLGRTLRVLFESSREQDDATVWSGLTDNYIRVEVAATADLRNRFGNVRALDAGERGIKGELVAAPSPTKEGRR